MHDVLAFGQKYFPHYCTHAASRLHQDLAATFKRVLESADSEREAIAAPRGHAKSTWASLIFPIYCIVHDLKHFPVIVSNESSLAVSLVEDIAHELEDNEDLARDFPHACGQGPVWQRGRGILVTRNDVKVLGLGAGKKIRGRKHRQYRPDLIILDDLENDEQCRNPEQRSKMHDWLNKAVLKAKGVAAKCDVFAVGTLLHFDSVLARLLDPRQSPGWRGRRYQAVIRWAERQDLWDRWTEHYTDWTKPDAERLAGALAFYQAHEADMLRGTEVLWPDAEDYYKLMRLRVDEGPTSFDSEKQNEPINQDECEFPESWFRWFDEATLEGQTWLVPEKGERVRLAECDVFGATDPSMGKRDKHRDPSAIVSLACWPSRRRLSGNEAYRLMFVLDGDIRRRHPHVIKQDIYDLHRLRHYQRHGIEAIQFQELFAQLVQEDALADRTLADLRIVQLKPHTDKVLRIQKLGPFFHAGRLLLSRKCVALYGHLRYFPQGAHDDGADALELALETAGAIGWVMVDLDDDDKTRSGKPRHPHAEALRRAMPGVFDRDDDGATCGNCAQRERDEAGRHMCLARDFLVKPEQPGCPEWDSRPDGADD